MDKKERKEVAITQQNQMVATRDVGGDQSEPDYKDPLVSFGGELTIFETPVSGVCYHKNKDNILLIYQPTDAKPAGVKVSDIETQLLNMLTLTGVQVPKIDVFSKIPQDIKNIIDDYTLCLHVIYLKVTKTAPTPPATDTTTKVEYALWISIDLDKTKKKALEDKFPVVLESLFFKIWSTKNDDVLKDMNISQIEKLKNSDGNEPAPA